MQAIRMLFEEKIDI